MRKTTALIVMIICLLPAVAFSDGIGSAFGTLRTAQALGMGKMDLGLGVGIADATTVFGTLEYGLSRYTDGRIKFGLYDEADDVNFAIGADINWQLWDVNEGRREPLDLGFGGFFEYIDAGPASAFEFGAAVLGSYPFALNNGGTLSPYGRFNVRLESLSWDDNFPGRDDSDTDIRFGLHGGVAWQATSTIGLFGEFQLDGNDGVFFGIDFNVQ